MFKVEVDTGGTFTDLAAIGEDGKVVVAKHPSTPRAPVDAFMGVMSKSGLSDRDIERITHGTTVATNAVIQRQGARVALVTTRGFEDVPFIQRINRKSEYDLHWRKPQPLVRRRWCVGARERVSARGTVTLALSKEATDEVIAAIRQIAREEAIEAVAVCLLFSYLNPAHELEIGRCLSEAFPDLPVSLSMSWRRSGASTRGRAPCWPTHMSSRSSRPIARTSSILSPTGALRAIARS